MSCEEQLDLAPITSIGESGYFKNSKEIDAGIFAVYDALQTVVKREFILCEIRSDNTTTVKGEGDFAGIDNFTESATNSITSAYWVQQYTLIGRANKVLKYTGNVTDVNTRNAQEAELRFLRAYSYFSLVRLFGNVPLVDHEVGPTETASFGNSTVADLYKFIETELTFAAANLPATRTGSDLGRATSITAKAVLAQVYFAQGKNTQALPLYDAVVGTYAFDITFANVFSSTNEMNNEIVFAVRFSSGVAEGQDIGYEFDAKGTFQGLNNPTPDMVAQYEAGDLRKAFCISTAAVPMLLKYSEDKTNDSKLDWVIIRKAEALLSRAEINATASTGIDQSAINDINLLRKRAGLTEYTAASFADKAALLTAIAKERRVELAFENYRWYDLVRMNNASSVMSAQLGKTIPAASNLYLIPQREIDASQGALVQNR
jgi:hypothetical protein